MHFVTPTHPPASLSPPSHTLPRRPHPFGPPHVLSSGSLRSPGTEPTREKRRGTRPFAGDSRRNRAKRETRHSFIRSLRRFLAHGVSLSSCLSLVTASLTPSSLRSRTAATSGRSFGRHSSHSVPLSSRVAPFGLPPAARNVKRRENCDMEISDNMYE